MFADYPGAFQGVIKGGINDYDQIFQVNRAVVRHAVSVLLKDSRIMFLYG
jgi:hypothetical protein